MAIWAYCLMPNHIHLIAVPETAQALRRAIGEAHRRYTRAAGDHRRLACLSRQRHPRKTTRSVARSWADRSAVGRRNIPSAFAGTDRSHPSPKISPDFCPPISTLKIPNVARNPTQSLHRQGYSSQISKFFWVSWGGNQENPFNCRDRCYISDYAVWTSGPRLEQLHEKLRREEL